MKQLKKNSLTRNGISLINPLPSLLKLEHDPVHSGYETFFKEISLFNGFVTYSYYDLI